MIYNSIKFCLQALSTWIVFHVYVCACLCVHRYKIKKSEQGCNRRKQKSTDRKKKVDSEYFVYTFNLATIITLSG